MNKFTQEEKIMYALKVLGIPQHIKGYDYIGSAIELVMKDREYIRQITTMLYPDIAKKHGTTPSRV